MVPPTYYQVPAGSSTSVLSRDDELAFLRELQQLRLTCDGKLRPCLGSYLEFDIMKPLRAGASDEELREFFLNVVDRKPEQHDFRTNYQPNRKMVQSAAERETSHAHRLRWPRTDVMFRLSRSGAKSDCRGKNSA